MLSTALDYFLGIEDSKLGIMQSTNIFKPLNYVELIDVDSVEACGITTDCTMKRTKEKLPKIRVVKGHQMIKRVTSLDGSTDLFETTQRAYNKKASLSTFKYDTNKYYWILNDYLYIPNVSWEAVSILAYFSDIALIDSLNDCNDEKNKNLCRSILDEEFPAPTHLLELTIDKVSSKIANLYNRIPEDNNINKNTNTL
jgi:hypothetical protein